MRQVGNPTSEVLKRIPQIRLTARQATGSGQGDLLDAGQLRRRAEPLPEEITSKTENKCFVGSFHSTAEEPRGSMFHGLADELFDPAEARSGSTFQNLVE